MFLERFSEKSTAFLPNIIQLTISNAYFLVQGYLGMLKNIYFAYWDF